MKNHPISFGIEDVFDLINRLNSDSNAQDLNQVYTALDLEFNTTLWHMDQELRRFRLQSIDLRFMTDTVAPYVSRPDAWYYTLIYGFAVKELICKFLKAFVSYPNYLVNLNSSVNGSKYDENLLASINYGRNGVVIGRLMVKILLARHG